MIRKGDTLIEVTLAVGIFSMVAIAVVSVMSGGTSSAQTALETTIAREEIDAQAEALRFIQSSYIADKDSGDNRFSDLWQEIKNRANTARSEVTTYAPTSCSDLYGSGHTIESNKGFVINTRKLGNFTQADEVIVGYNSTAFTQTTTHPRLLFGKNNTENEDKSNLVDSVSYDQLYRAEGIYVVAVKDGGSNIVSGSTTESKQAYYDFYIRTCWYGTGADTPSTISTVIRLYDPDALEAN